MNKKRLTIIIFVILIICSLVILLFRNLSRPNTPTRTSPTPFPTFTQEQIEQANQTEGEAGFTPKEAQEFSGRAESGAKIYQDRKTRLPFIESLPYTTNNFKIQIMATSDTVTISTYGTTREENLLFRQQALDWLRSNGADFDLFQVVYNPENL